MLIANDLITAHNLNRALNFDAAVLDATLLQQDIGYTTFLEDDKPVVLMKTSQGEYQFAFDAAFLCEHVLPNHSKLGS